MKFHSKLNIAQLKIKKSFHEAKITHSVCIRISWAGYISLKTGPFLIALCCFTSCHWLKTVPLSPQSQLSKCQCYNTLQVAINRSTMPKSFCSPKNSKPVWLNHYPNTPKYHKRPVARNDKIHTKSDYVIKRRYKWAPTRWPASDTGWLGISPRIKVQEGQGKFWRANTKLPSVWKGTKAISVSLKGHLGQCQKFEGHQGNCTRIKVKYEKTCNKYQ